MPNLKQPLIEAAEYYERKAEYYRRKVENATPDSRIQHEYRAAHQYNLGRAKAMREALEYIDEFLG